MKITALTIIVTINLALLFVVLSIIDRDKTIASVSVKSELLFSIQTFCTKCLIADDPLCAP